MFKSELSSMKNEIHELKASQNQIVLSPVSSSNADHGKKIMDALKDDANNLIVLPGEGESVLPFEIVAQAQAYKDEKKLEKELVNLYTPYLEDIVNEIEPLVLLVNSEEYKWLRSSSGHSECEMKPDLFIAYHGLVEKKTPYHNAPINNSVERIFGKFPCWNCRSSLWCILDAKWKIDDEAFGEKVKYLQSCGFQCRIWKDSNQPLKLLLFDIEEFWMIVGQGLSINELRKCKWTQAGSRQVLKQFLTTNDPWMNATEFLLKNLECQLASNSPILGAGSYGRAFLLDNGQVLKVVVGPNAYHLEREYLKIQLLQDSPDTERFVVPIVDGSFRRGKMENIEFAGYLLQCKGDKIQSSPTIRNRNRMTNIQDGDIEVRLVKFLYELHLTGITHGDPRVDNALLVKNELKWIDFMDSNNQDLRMRIEDFSLLFNSLTHVKIDILRNNIKEILEPDLVGSMSQLSTNDQSHKLNSLINYLVDLLSNVKSVIREEKEKEISG